MNRRLTCALLVGMTGCMRGCPVGSQTASRCDDQSDCDDDLVCHRGYCVTASYARDDRGCRGSPACGETGACDSVLSSSFLGLSSKPMCGAIDIADCRASRICKTDGKCSLADVYCVADNTADCARSTRCQTFEECAFEAPGSECVRRWPACPALPDVPGAPAWAEPGQFTGELDTLAAWTPGSVDDAVVICRVVAKRRGPSTLRIADRCAPGPVFGKRPETFVRSAVRLHPGDTITVAVQQDPAVGRPSTSSFAKATYAGASPFRGGTPGESIECQVVAPEVARTLAKPELAAADRELATARRERADHGIASLPRSITRARRAVSRAAVWLGWADPAIADRLRRLDTAERAWQVELDKELAKRWKQAGPAADAGDGFAVRTHAVICGDALRVRLGTRATGRAIGPTECGLELMFANTGPDRTPSTWKFELSGARFLRPSRPGHPAEVIEAELVDERASDPGVQPDPTRGIPHGGQAIVLFAPTSAELELGPDGLDPHVVFQARKVFGRPFELRAEL